MTTGCYQLIGCVCFADYKHWAGVTGVGFHVRSWTPCCVFCRTGQKVMIYYQECMMKKFFEKFWSLHVLSLIYLKVNLWSTEPRAFENKADTMNQSHNCIWAQSHKLNLYNYVCHQHINVRERKSTSWSLLFHLPKCWSSSFHPPRARK